MNNGISLYTSSIRHSILVLHSKDIFEYLKNHKSYMGGQTKTSIKHENQMLTLKWKIVCINITNSQDIILLHLISTNKVNSPW